MRIAFVLAALLLGRADALCAQVPDPVGPQSGFSLDEAGLKKLAKTLPNNRQLLDRLRPGYAECRAIVSGQSDAIRLYHYVSLLFKRIPEKGIPVPKDRSVIQVATVRPHDKEDKPASFAPKLAEHAKSLSSKLTFYGLRFRQPDGKLGTKVNTFVAVNGRWVIIPSLERGLADKELLGGVNWLFCQTLSSGNYHDAYALMSARVTEQFAADKLPEVIKKAGWRPHTKVDWRGFRRLYALGGEFIEWNGQVVFQDGGQADISLYAAREGDDLRIVLFSLESRFGVNPPSLFAPEPAKCRQIAHDLGKKVVLAIGKKDFAALHGMLAKELRDQLKVEQLAAAFDKLSKAGDLTFVQSGQVELKFFPSVGTNDYARPISRIELLKKRGALNIHGWIKNKTQGKQLSFQFAIKWEDKQWRPVRLTLGLPEPFKQSQKQ